MVSRILIGESKILERTQRRMSLMILKTSALINGIIYIPTLE